MLLEERSRHRLIAPRRHHGSVPGSALAVDNLDLQVTSAGSATLREHNNPFKFSVSLCLRG
jgi:hypothetical protein